MDLFRIVLTTNNTVSKARRNHRVCLITSGHTGRSAYTPTRVYVIPTPWRSFNIPAISSLLYKVTPLNKLIAICRCAAGMGSEIC